MLHLIPTKMSRRRCHCHGSRRSWRAERIRVI
jgi:hypothetical protein